MSDRRQPLRRLFSAVVLSLLAAIAAVKANPLGFAYSETRIFRPFSAQTAVADPFEAPAPLVPAPAPAAFASAAADAGGAEAATACGANGQRACSIFDVTFGGEKLGCTKGERLVEAPGCFDGDQCNGSIGHCVQKSPCGGEGQRACTIGEGTACQSGLTEIEGCTGDCLGGFFLGIQVDSSGMCVAVSECGGAGQRACTIDEQIPSCDPPLVEIPGCSGDCWSKGGDRSLGMCTQKGVTPIAEPATNAFTVPGACSAGGPQPLRGYMDMHMHQFAHMAHGGGVLAGKPYDAQGGVNVALRPDFTTDVDLVNGDGSPLGLWSEDVQAAQTDGNPLSDLLADIQVFAGNLITGLLECPAELYGNKCTTENYFHGFHDPLIGDSIGSVIGTQDGAWFSNFGAPLFNGWPKWTSTTHQQVYYKWLERAYQGGLRMMTELAVTNEALCRGNKHIANTVCSDGMKAIDDQIQAAKDFERFIDLQDDGQVNLSGWYRIVTTPSQAREAIARGKMAVTLGIETAELFNCYEIRANRQYPQPQCTEAGVLAKVDEYYNKGIRVIFPIHNFDNAFGAAATWQDGIEVGQRVVEGRWWEVRDCSAENYGFQLGGGTQMLITLLRFTSIIPTFEVIGYPEQPAATCNNKGMTGLGEQLMKKLMAKGMIIDVDHMSNLSLNRALQLAENFDHDGNPSTATVKYPGIVASHVLSFDRHKKSIVVDDETKGTRHERHRTSAQLQKIRNVGGMVAAMLKDDGQDTSLKAEKYTEPYGNVPDDCRHSSKTFAHAYQYLVDQMGGPVALGSDFNGVAGHIGPRFGIEACGGWDGDRKRIAERNAQLRNITKRVSYPFTIDGFGSFQKQVTGQRTFDYNYDGMAHVGMLPDFIEDLEQVGLQPQYLDSLFGSAEAYVKMWEGATKTTATPNDDTPPAAVTDPCGFFTDPDLEIAGPSSVNEGASAQFTITARKGWQVTPSCMQAPGTTPGKVLSQSVTTDTSDLVYNSFSITCSWGGGSWGAPQIGRVFAEARREFQAPVFVKDVTVVNVAPSVSTPPPTNAATGKKMLVPITLTDGPLENLKVSANWGDNKPAGDLVDAPAGPGVFTLNHVYTAAGTYVVQVTVRDEGPQPAITAFAVTVSGLPDTTPPTITVPDDLSVPQDLAQGAIVTYTVTASDGDNGPIPAFCDKGFTDLFAIGTTTVNCHAIDASNNRVDDSFKITVVPGGRVAVIVPQYEHPVRHWRLNEGAGQRVMDTAAAGATPGFLGVPFLGLNDAVWASANFCTGTQPVLSFTGAGASVADLGAGSGDSLGSDQWTLAFWFKTTAQNGTMFSNGNFNLTGRARMKVWLNNRSVTVTLTHGSGFVFSVHDGLWVDDGKWHHVAVRRDGSKLELFIDGSGGTGTTQKVGDREYEAFSSGHMPGTCLSGGQPSCDDEPEAWFISQSSASLLLGGLTTTFGNPTEQFAGSMSDVQIFAEKLNTNAIERIVDSRTDSNNDGTCNEVLPDVTRIATSASGGTVAFTVSAHDSITNAAKPFTCTLPNGLPAASGAVYPIGATKVTCKSTSTLGVESTESFNIVVEAGNAPLITVPANITVNAVNVHGTPVAYTATAFDKQDGTIAPTCTPIGSGGTFPIGVQTVNCTATDRDNNSASGSFTVTVVDGAPFIEPRANLVMEATAPNGRLVNYTPPDLVDAVDGRKPAGCAPAAGSTFALGSTIVRCDGKDSAGNNAPQTSFLIIVQDTIKPVVTPAVNPAANALGWHRTSPQVSWTATDAVGVTSKISCDTQTITVESSGLTLNCFAFDAAGNQGIGSVFLKIDKIAPSVLFGSPLPAPNAGGWHNANATLEYVAGDGRSGLADGSPASGVLSFTTEGMGVTQSVTVLDKAGNSFTATSLPVNLDKTAPTITAARAPVANAHGWNNTDVTASFTCTDGLSQIDFCSPADTLTDEGGGQSRSGMARDKAGNTATASADDINIDKTAPVVTGQRNTPANGNGWNNTPVGATFSATDALSDIDGEASLDVSFAEGANQSATRSFKDRAGNSASATVDRINVDLTPPTITAARAPMANGHGWNNTDVTATFTCADGLSQIDFCSPADVLTGEGGGQSSAGTARDQAGNTATASVGDINIDKTAPTVVTSRTPANGNGWNNTSVMVQLSAQDALSGVDGDFGFGGIVSTEGANQSVSHTFTDLAGNSAPASVTGINIDKTAPTITGAADRPANANGWYNADVTVTFTCADGLSGVDACTAPELISQEQANQSSTGTVVDKAGNRAQATVGAINLDKTAPTVQCSTNTTTLWPPNHKMVTVNTGVSVTDALTAGVKFTLASVTSNEPDNGLGDGDTANDIQGFTLGTADTSGQFRAERSGKGNSRVYSLRYQSIDLAGNTGVCTVTTTVPHDQSKTTSK